MPPPLPANLNQPQNVQQLSASGAQQSGPQTSQFHQQHVAALAQHHHQNVGAGSSTGALGVSGSGGIQQITASSSSIQSGSNIIGGINVLPPGVQQQHLNVAQKLHAQHLQQQQLQQQHQQQQHQQSINTASAAGLVMSSGGGIPSDTLLTTEINKFRSYVVMLADHTSKDDSKLKAAQELNESFEIILQAPDYPKFLDHCIKNFLKILSEGEPLFISEYNIQQMRKLLLEMIHRFPTNQDLKPHLPAILTTVLRLLNVENEENTLVCLRIIIELHKMFRPPYNTETQKFLQYVKSIYAELPNHLNRIFEPRSTLKVKDLSAINIEQQLKDTFTLTIIQSEMKSQDGTAICYNLIPKGTMSLKVLQELPIIVVLFFQIYKENVKQDIREYITLIMNTITLQPSLEQRKSPSFNKEVFVDFMGAQIKTLSFIAYIIRSHHEDVAAHSQQMVHGILGLLELCPQEVCHLRKELLIAIRHIVATDLKKKFVPHMERLFDENILLGNGWTVRDTLRPLAYSTLADLVHHVRQDLPLTDLARAVHLFGKIVHDPTLNTTIQTMSCKLLLNLVDCIKNQSKGEKNAVQCRELLMRMLEIFVLKFKTFAKLQLPILINKSKPLMQQNLQSQVSVNNMTAYQQQQLQQQQQSQQSQQSEIKQEPGTNNVDIKQEPGQGTARLASTLTASATGNVPPPIQQEAQEKSKFGFPQQQMSYNVADYRNLVKTLVCGVKTITWGCSSININELPNGEQGKDTLVFIRLVKWAMKALDIYQVQLPNVGVLAQFQGRQMHNRMMSGPNQNVRTQEEKEVLEHFSGVFSLMSTSVFRDVFSTCISYMVERIHQNVALQTIANTFLANPPTSSVFATVLVEYLLERMNEMGSPIDRSNLYLRLFKVLFGSVTLFKENELMLKPHLHQIVNRSMELSTNAKEPYNYFLLLRALFRSIGGGSHDLLYEVFLPLLPNLLEGLNRLQSGLHKPHMKDLFVELCLTVPVRLSSLLPYLPMLMDPLVSALNGSHTLVSQGLRTLELCVDNLQPEFLYEHIQPVRADLMQALWRTLRNPDQVAHVAFRVLGKFGGGNRKMMIEPQRLEYNDRENPGPAIVVEFQDHERSIEFPVEKIIETAVNALKSSTTDSFYHKQCWEVIRCYLAASLNLTDRKHTMLGLFLYPSFVNDPIDQTTNPIPLYKCPDRVARKTHLTALTGMFVAAAIKELRQDVQPRMVSLVTHYTMVAIAQQAGPAPIKGKVTPSTFLDPLVLIDALAVIMAHEEKELCKPGYLALGLILDTATNILGSKEKACQLPLMDYLKDRMCALCYERAWYSKLGGCIAIKFLFERMSTRWVYQHLYTFLKALMFVMMDLTGEVSSGALDMAKSNLRKMLTICIAPVDPKIVTSELLTAREKALYDVTSELLGLVTSPHTLVREQAMYCIRVLAGCCGTKGVDPQFSSSILAPHIEVLTDIVNSNVLELNKETIDKITNICIVQCDLNKPNNNTTINTTSNSTNLNTEDVQTARDKAFYDVTNELARLATQEKYEYKEHVVYCLRVLITCKTILNALSGGVTTTTSTITTTTATTIAATQPQTPSSTLLSSDTTPASSTNATSNTIMPMVMQPHLDVLKAILTSDGFSTVAKVMVSHIDILKTTIPNWSADATKLNIERLLILLCTTMNEYKTIITQSSSPAISLTQQQLNNIIQVRDKVIQDVTNELVRLIATLTTTHTSSSASTAVGSTNQQSTSTASSQAKLSTNQQTLTASSSQAATNVNTNYLLIKEQAMYCLRVFAECNGFSGGDDGSIASIMSPHIEVLKDIVPPTKHQLILQPANAQIGLMDGNTFCMMLTPRLFTFDLKIPTHKSFFDELLLLLCKSHDALTKLQCYKNISNLVLVRKAALLCISTYHRLPKDISVKIFQVLYDALGWENNELQETAYECMHKFINGYQIDIDLVRQTMRTLLISLGDSRNLTLNFVKRLSYLTKLFPAIFNEKLCEQLLQHLKQFLDNLKDAKKLTKNGENEQKIAIIILIFHRITSASPKFISILCELVLETEKQLLVEASSAFREPLMKFLLKHPGDTLELFLQDYRLKDQQWSRYLIYLIKHNDGKSFRDYLQNYCVPRLIQLLLIMQNNTNQQLTLQDKYELRHQSIRIISLLIKYDSQWLSKQPQIIDGLKQIWCDDAYQELHTKVDTVDITHWKQPKLIVKILLQYFQHDPQQIELLFELLRAFCHRFIPDFQFLRDFLETCVAQNYTIEWKRQAFFKFVEVFKNDQVSQVLKCHIVQLILIPCFSDSGTENMNALIAGTGNIVDSQQPNVVTIFIYNIIEKQSFNLEDCLRIALLQFSCLLVEQASPHIHDSSSNKQQGNKLRKLMTFAWPCLLVKNCVDATTRYHGHLLLAHIIEKFAIHKKIVLQVFHSLVKAHAQEARAVVKQALEILTPAMPFRMEDGNTMLIHWTKKIIVEEGHSVQQLYHILQLVVRHYKVYYPVRHHLIQYIVNSINRLGFSQTSTLEHKKLAVELAEVIVKWELQRLKDDEVDDLVQQDKKRVALTGPNQQPIPASTQAGTTTSTNILNTPGQPPQSTTPSPKIDADARKPIKSKDADAVINFLLRLACQVNESTNSAIPIQQAGGAGTPGEMLSKRCVTLLKTALKPELWPQKCDLKLDEWFNKVFLTVDGRDPNYANISTALELLNFLLSVMKHEQILNNFVHLQTGLSACLYTKETKIISLVHNLLSKLVSMFPVDLSGANFGCQYEQLRVLYCNVGTMISDGLRNYEEDPKPVPSSLFGPLMILKACCTKNPAGIDKIITAFMKVLQKMTKEHLSSTSSNDNSGPDKLASELLILSLDLVKTRVVVMSVEQRKTFIGTILVGLIEKTQDIKVMRAITRMLEEWIKCRNSITLQQAPSLREKSILLVKLMQYVEKRFPDDIELNTQFLELVNYVYSDEHLKTTELSMKLQPAFMSGLRCTVQPAIRAKFFQVLDASMRRRLIDRLLYIVCSQSWDAIGPHYWLKQCIELLLVTAVSSKPIQMAPNSCLLPSVEAVLRNTDSKVKDKVFEFIQKDPVICAQQQQSLSTTDTSGGTPQKSKPDRIQTIEQHVNQQADYLSKAREVETGQFLQAAAQLCHMDTQLAERVWLDMFPRLWSILYSNQHTMLIPEIVSFVSSGTHVIQKDCHPSAMTTFLEALSQCTPTIPIKPAAMKYLGKSHNLWHRMTLNLEQMAFDQNASTQVQKQKRDANMDCYDFESDQISPQAEIMDSLSDMYALLSEDDMWSGLWQRHAKFRETIIAISFEQHGFFEQAQGAYEVAMSRYKQDTNVSQKEVLLWEQRWIRCAKELNQWDLLLEYGVSKHERNSFLILESSWRVPNWTAMKEALAQVEYSCPKEMAWKVNLYRGFLGICNTEERHLQVVDRCVELASGLCMREWRRLPKIVSHAHLPLLQAAQQIMELQEAAAQIYQRLVQPSPGLREPYDDMKAIVKTWKNRLPVISDDLSHWSDIFTWRQHHYQFIAKYYDNGSAAQGEGTISTRNPAMLGIHASAQAIIHFAKIARKHNLTGVCLESLSRIYTIPLVPVGDIFEKFCQHVKCYLQMAAVDNAKASLEEGYKVVETTNLSTFTDMMKAEYYAMKGLFLAQLGKSDEANKAFSAAVQINDTDVKAWALWGDYLEALFTRDRTNIQTGVSAITCFLHTCRTHREVTPESKSRKYLAKVLWLLTYDDDKSSLMEALEKYSNGVPALHWLPWTPQLVSCLVQYPGEVIFNLLTQVARVFPQAVYLPMRTLYLTIKIEQRVGHKTKMGVVTTSASGGDNNTSANAANTAGQNSDLSQSQSEQQKTQQEHMQQQQSSAAAGGQGQGGSIRANPPLLRCTNLLRIVRDIHPIVLQSLEGFVEEMSWFRETWYEEVLRQLRQCLAKCYAVAFENRSNVNEAKITPHISNFVHKLVTTFGTGIENIANSAHEISSLASESLARRIKATTEDPVFQKIKTQFTQDFDSSHLTTMKLHNLINKLKKWVKILESKTKVLPRSLLIEEKCRFLSNFSLKTAEVELPGEFLLPKHPHYFVRIARFMPKADIVQKHNTAARRLYIRGHNGKIYPYLVVIDGIGDGRREERVLQLLRMLNHYLCKQKETSKRFLHYTVPRVVAVSPQIRLVEDNPASISLLDIFKNGCAKLNIDYCAPITMYYERLANAQQRGQQASHPMLRDILKSVQSNMVPKTMLKNWALQTFPSATDYWTFRKMFTLQLALACFGEYVLHLTRLNPDMMYLHQDSGLINISYFKFDVDDHTGELDTNRPVPFRLTPNIIEFLTCIGVSGPLTASMIAAARCLVQPNFKVQSILRAILKDEMIAGHKKKLNIAAAAAAAAAAANASSGGVMDNTVTANLQQQESDTDHLINMVNKAVNVIASRLNGLANFDVNDSKVSTLVVCASSADNLCRMDPAWHPWL